MSVHEVARLFKRVMGDEVLRTALERSIASYWDKRKKVFARYPEVEELASEVRKIRERSVENIEELAAKAMESVEARGGKAYLARDAEEARRIIGEIVGTGRIVTKAKSMTTEELKLREYLIERGNEVYETDLGEFLIQFLGPKPMHFISPSIHLTRERVAEFLREFMGVEVDKDDVEGMVALVRKFLRDKYFSSDVGISGANAFAADEGAVFLIENESNIRLTISLPKKYIAVVGMEKIVPTVEDAWKVVEVISRYGGYKVTSYISVAVSPVNRAEWDISPEEFHVVIVDNGRSEAAKDEVIKQTLYCLRCGACQYLCPVFGVVAGYWSGLDSAYSGGIGVMWEYVTGNKEVATAHSFACLLCGRCIEACPVSIDQPEVLREIRARYLRGR